ncbi:uncharacterized protein [Nicotiana tomentosiformis]|uniref:Uncharacterized protein isoform X5 n=1 Tax=Nicotiana tabacum TaxID=4097 RepID=A0A1S4CFG9_TOBAC|nr:PREDICTED: uncharacterized protein LOC107818248 isoform X5 [Nicotiana tabacum]XP_033508941.1 uncharacterized protein LOC104084719 isoform X4 [Nicotiana tomentosiformis]
MSDLTKLSNVSNHSDLPSTFQPQQIAQLATTLPAIFNSLYARRAIIPAANGHCSARALARYYAALAEGGRVPPPHYSSMPTLGSHPHIPKFPSQQTVKKQKSRKKTAASDADGPGPTQNSSSSVDNGYGNDGKGNVYVRIPDDNSCSGGDTSSDNRNIKLFHNQRVHDAFMGVGEYENLTDPNGEFGLGFKRSYSTSGELIGFGHSGSNIGEGRTRGSIIPAMDAVIRVFKRVSGLEADGNLPGAAGAAFCSIRLLVASTQAVNLIGKQGSLIKPIQQTTGASIRVLSNGAFSHSSSNVVDIHRISLLSMIDTAGTVFLANDVYFILLAK